MPIKPYTPQLSRLNVCALFHEARSRNIPMTRLADQIVAKALEGTTAWTKAKNQLQESPTIYQTKAQS